MIRLIIDHLQLQVTDYNKLLYYLLVIYCLQDNVLGVYIYNSKLPHTNLFL